MPALIKIFPYASKTFIELNGKETHPELESHFQIYPPLEDQGKERNTKRRVLRYTSYRRKLVDPDNLCTKFFTDALRYCGAIPDDTSDDIILEIRQKKVDTLEEEKTLIELFE